VDVDVDVDVDSRYILSMRQRYTHVEEVKPSRVPGKRPKTPSIDTEEGSPSLRKTEGPDSEEPPHERSPSTVTNTPYPRPSFIKPRLTSSAFLAFMTTKGTTSPQRELHYQREQHYQRELNCNKGSYISTEGTALQPRELHHQRELHYNKGSYITTKEELHSNQMGYITTKELITLQPKRNYTSHHYEGTLHPNPNP